MLKVIDVDEYQYEHYSSEIRKKRFCYSETDKLIADYKVVYYEADKTEFKVLESGKVRMEMTVPGGVVYYYPKGTFAESKTGLMRHMFLSIIEMLLQTILKA